MRAKTLQILWHGKEPVYSVDFHSSGMLATAGADKEIKLWEVTVDDANVPAVRHLESLTGHNKGINTVRFSPDGETLSSGGDSGEVILWKATGEPLPDSPSKEGQVTENCTWKVNCSLRGHTDDVQDLAWAPDSQSLLTGSVDNSSIVWDAVKGKPTIRMGDHQHYVQGVAWDPLGHHLVSISGDRTCRVYGHKPLPKKLSKQQQQQQQQQPDDGLYVSTSFNASNLVCQHVLCKRELQAEAPKQGNDQAPQPQKAPKHCLFHDDTVPSFFRRLAWSPEGSFLALPTGLYKPSTSGEYSNTVYFYSRTCLARPAMHVPGFKSPVVAIRFCPILFAPWPGKSDGKPADDKPSGGFALPYRIVVAVASVDSILVLDTQTATPLALIGGAHYASITDLAWNRTATQLVVSSSDGFCSIVAFAKGELGDPLPPDQLPPYVQRIMSVSSRSKEDPALSPSTPAQPASVPQEEHKAIPESKATNPAQSSATPHQDAFKTPAPCDPPSHPASTFPTNSAQLPCGNAAAASEQKDAAAPESVVLCTPTPFGDGSARPARRITAETVGAPMPMAPLPENRVPIPAGETSQPAQKHIVPQPLQGSSQSAQKRVVPVPVGEISKPAQKRIVPQPVRETSQSAQKRIVPVPVEEAAQPAPKRIVPQPVGETSQSAQKRIVPVLVGGGLQPTQKRIVPQSVGETSQPTQENITPDCEHGESALPQKRIIAESVDEPVKKAPRRIVPEPM